MAQPNIEGEIENITEIQLAFIKSVIEKEGFKDSKVTIETVGGAADNYGANVKRIFIEGGNGNLSIFAKIAPTLEIVRKTSNVPLAFHNEHLMYTEVLPKFLQLQKQAKIPEEDRIKFPKCYGTYLEAPNEVILIEDLKPSGFTMMDRLVSLSDECVTSILRHLAIFHSLSYVLKSKEPETFDHFRDNLRDVMGAMNEGTFGELDFFNHVETRSLSLLENPEHQNVMRNAKVGETTRLVIKMTKFEHDSRYSAIVHGDCWTNNFLFKLEVSIFKLSYSIFFSSPLFPKLIVFRPVFSQFSVFPFHILVC